MKYVVLVAAAAFASTAFAQDTIPVAGTNLYQAVAEGTAAPAPVKKEVAKPAKKGKAAAAKSAPAAKKAAKQKKAEKKAEKNKDAQ